MIIILKRILARALVAVIVLPVALVALASDGACIALSIFHLPLALVRDRCGRYLRDFATVLRVKG